MKKKIILGLVASLTAFSLLFFGSTAVSAQESLSVVLPAGEVVNHDYLTAGENVTLSGTVNGDVLVAGGTVTVDGVVNGDLLAAGGNVNLLGRVSEDVRVAGGNVFVNGTVGKNVTLAGGNLILSPLARVIGNLVTFGGNLDLKAPVGGDVTVFGGKVLLGGNVGGNVTGAMEKIELSPEARVFGRLEYRSPEPATMASGAAVRGETIHREIDKGEFFPAENWRGWRRDLKAPAAVMGTISVYLKVVSLVLTFILGWAFFSLFPKRTDSILKTLKNRFWPCFLTGLASMILLAPAVVFLAISLIGIPLIFILIPAYLFLAFLAKIFLAEVLGEKLLGTRVKKGKLLWPLLAGLVIYYLLRFVPVAGPLAVLIFAASGLGAIWLGFRGKAAARR